MCQSYAYLSQFADLSPDGRKGSFIGVRRLANEELPAPGADPPPTNEAVAQAVQEKVAVSMLQLCCQHQHMHQSSPTRILCIDPAEALA